MNEALDDTGQPAVSQEDGQEDQPRTSPRDEAMQRMVEARQAQEAEEIAGTGEQPDTDDQTSEPVYRNNDGQYVTRVKVNGQEFETTLDDLKAKAQMNWAADQRLQQAKELQYRLQQQQAELETRANQQQESTNSDESDDLTESSREIVDLLYDGESDEAAARLASIMRGRNTSDSAEQAAQKALQILNQQAFDREVVEGNREFASEFSDLAEDPDLYRMANQRTIDLMQQHPDWTPKQVIKTAGEQTRTWLQQKTGRVSDTREGRKQQLSSLPRSGAGTPYQHPEEPPPQTASDVIQEMRRQRGQA